MFAREFHPPRFLRSVAGTEPFRSYCRLRGIPLDLAPTPREGEFGRWADAVAALTPDAQARIELDFARVNELAGRDGNAHLEEAAGGNIPPADVPGGAALALWCFVHRPALFEDVFFYHEVRDARAWRTATAAAGVGLADLPARAEVLGRELRAFFHPGGAGGRFCAVDARALPDVACFAARVADRLQLVEGFTDAGRPALQRVRPALAVLFAYSARDGTVRMASPLRAAERVADLFQCFGRAVLGGPVACGGAIYDLDRLKEPFRSLPDAADMFGVRLKALHLRYPARLGRRVVKIETLSGDAPTAIDDLLRAHAGGAVTDLTVCYAELEVRLLVGSRMKGYVIRLWPDRCNLPRTPLGDRLRQCLRRWGLCHA